MSAISFTDYVSKHLDNELWKAMENYLSNANSSNSEVMSISGFDDMSEGHDELKND